MSNGGLVSVVLPLYNRENTIERAIRSILNQTYADVEVLVVDDCSSDKSVDIVTKIDDDRVRLIRLKENGGACKARNRGIEEAKGAYIAFQDSDDEWLPEKLKNQLEALKKDETDINFCAFNRVSKRKIEKIPDKNVEVPKRNEEFVKKLLEENFISTQTILAKREVFKNVRFDENLPRFQDWDLAIRLAMGYSISYLNESLVNVYIQNDSITKNGEKGIRALEIILKKYWDICKDDPGVMRAFLYKKCILGYKAGVNMKNEAKEYLQRGFNLKVFYVYLWSLVKGDR